MRKLTIAGMALAVLAIIPAAASASPGVERCQVTTTVAGPSVTTAKFTVTEPRGSKDDFSSFWTSSYEVQVSTDGKTFEGTGNLTDGAGINVALTIKGTFNSDDTISYVAAPADTDSPVRWVLENGKTDGTVNPASTLNVEGPSDRHQRPGDAAGDSCLGVRAAAAPLATWNRRFMSAMERRRCAGRVQAWRRAVRAWLRGWPRPVAGVVWRCG